LKGGRGRAQAADIAHRPVDWIATRLNDSAISLVFHGRVLGVLPDQTSADDDFWAFDPGLDYSLRGPTVVTVARERTMTIRCGFDDGGQGTDSKGWSEAGAGS